MIFLRFFAVVFIFFSLPANADSGYAETPFYTPQNKAVTLQEVKGIPALVFLWSKTCAVCLKSLKELDSLRQKYPESRLKIFPIMTKGANLNDARRVMVKMDIRSLPIYLDKNELFAHAAGLQSFPLTLLISADGREEQRLKGKIVWDSPSFASKIRSLIKEVSNDGK